MALSGFSGGMLSPLVLLAYLAVAVGLGWLLLKLIALLGKGLGYLFRAIAWPFRQIFRFVHGMVTDVLGLIGSVLTAAFFVPLVLFNLAMERRAIANHYGEALQREIEGIAGHVYRLVLGHASRLLCLTRLTEGVERRIPEAMARSPVEMGRLDRFDGYTVVGTLPAGGSGGRLYLADPSVAKVRQFTEAGLPAPQQVVIKSFALGQGSTLPQIVRENRSLEAARRLGLVLEHRMSPKRFFYVMPYVPGEDLSVVARRLHDRCGPAGLDDRTLTETLGFVSDVLETLQRFHAAGLWHKDIKPGNIIVSEGRASLVDIGLTTPLQSSMTLTTHGTEYYRDPELVRLALQGVKVHEVNGVKFDIYGAGAVLYSLIENGFPAHGSLSRITRRCPEALRWIVRRAMADMDRRYGSAAEMLADLRVVHQASDPFAVKPADLPSVSGTGLPQAGASIDPRPAALPSPPTHRRRKRSAGHILAAAAVGCVAWTAGWHLLASRGVLPRASSLIGFPSLHSSVPAPVATAGWQTTIPEPVTVAAGTPAPSAGRVILVLNDLSKGASDIVERTCASLERVRYPVLGPGRPGADPQQEIALLAGARAAAGLGTAADPEARQRLARFLQSLAEEELHAILWFGEGDRPGEVIKTIITRDRADSRVLMSILQSVPAPAG